MQIGLTSLDHNPFTVFATAVEYEIMWVRENVYKFALLKEGLSRNPLKGCSNSCQFVGKHVPWKVCQKPNVSIILRAPVHIEPVELSCLKCGIIDACFVYKRKDFCN